MGRGSGTSIYLSIYLSIYIYRTYKLQDKKKALHCLQNGKKHLNNTDVLRNLVMIFTQLSLKLGWCLLRNRSGGGAEIAENHRLPKKYSDFFRANPVSTGTKQLTYSIIYIYIWVIIYTQKERIFIYLLSILNSEKLDACLLEKSWNLFVHVLYSVDKKIARTTVDGRNPALVI